jgi:hypothetical protein
MLVAPILAVLAYFLTDYYVSEKPHVAKQGESYPLVAKPNCRYPSGKCELKNGDFIVTLKPTQIRNGKASLTLTANIPLEGVKIAIGQPPKTSATPGGMRALDTTNKKWQILDQPSSNDSHLQLVISAHGSFYYAEVTTVFFTEERPYKGN